MRLRTTSGVNSPRSESTRDARLKSLRTGVLVRNGDAGDTGIHRSHHALIGVFHNHAAVGRESQLAGRSQKGVRAGAWRRCSPGGPPSSGKSGRCRSAGESGQAPSRLLLVATVRAKCGASPARVCSTWGISRPSCFQQLHIHGRAQLAKFLGRDRQAVFGDDVLRPGAGGNPVVFVFLPADRNAIGLLRPRYRPGSTGPRSQSTPRQDRRSPRLVPYPLLCRDVDFVVHSPPMTDRTADPSAAWATVFRSLGLPLYQVRVEDKTVCIQAPAGGLGQAAGARHSEQPGRPRQGPGIPVCDARPGLSPAVRL